jgi:hypothetical protein
MKDFPLFWSRQDEVDYKGELKVDRAACPG